MAEGIISFFYLYLYKREKGRGDVHLIYEPVLSTWTWSIEGTL